MILTFTLWQHGGGIGINPADVTCVEQEGHHPPACSVYIRGLPKPFLIKMEWKEFVNLIDQAQSPQTLSIRRHP